MKDEKRLISNFLDTKSESDFLPIYDLCNESLYRVSLYLARRDEELAFDFLQDTWVTGLEKLSKFEGKSSLKSWLTGILINKSRNYWRKSSTDSMDSIIHEIGIEEENYAIRKMDLDYALMHLSDRYREVLLLHDLEGYKHKEIAEMLGIVEGTSKSLLFQARKVMRRLIQTYRNETARS